MKKTITIVILLSLCLSMFGCGKSQAATDFENMVAAIETVSLDSEAVIVGAENAYAALSDKDKEIVSGSYVTLTALRTKYDKIVAEAKAAEEKAAEDKRLAEELTEVINQLGSITLESKQALDAALDLYNSLSEEAMALVPNLDTLIQALTEYLTLRQTELDKVINKTLKNFTTETDAFNGITWYAPKGYPQYANVRCYLVPAIGVSGNNIAIDLCYHYTGDDWIFCEKITLLVDGEKYYKTPGYNGFTRDNAYGDVWEYYDEIFDYNLPMDSEKMQMLKKIAESKETIIRFEGDNYYYDYTVKSDDKKMIQNVLALYEPLLEKNSLFSLMPGYVAP